MNTCNVDERTSEGGSSLLAVCAQLNGDFSLSNIVTFTVKLV